jgi:hypothetical protein
MLGSVGAILAAEGIANADLYQLGERLSDTTQQATESVRGDATKEMAGVSTRESWEPRVPYDEL